MQEKSTGSEPRVLPPRILIDDADADADALRTLSDAVTASGHTVCHAAEPGTAAIDLPAGAGPDLALIGLEASAVAETAIETAEQIAERLGVPLVYAVETADDALLDRAQRTNPHGYVLKPADPRQLGLTLRAALNVAAQQRADRERHERTMAEIEASSALAERDNAVLRCLFERISDAVILGDSQGTLTEINPAARRLGRTSLQDPNTWAEYLTTYQADGRTPFAMEDMPLARAVGGETTPEVPVMLRPRHPDAGTEDMWLSASGYPLLDAQGRSLGGAVLLRDVTALSGSSRRRRKGPRPSCTGGCRCWIPSSNPSAERIVGIGMTDRPPDEWTDLYGVYYDDASNAMEATDERAARLEDDPGWWPWIRVLAYRGVEKNHPCDRHRRQRHRHRSRPGPHRRPSPPRCAPTPAAVEPLDAFRPVSRPRNHRSFREGRRRGAARSRPPSPR